MSAIYMDQRFEAIQRMTWIEQGGIDLRSRVPAVAQPRAETDFKEFRQLAEAIGFTAVLWSQIERQLDNWVMVTFTRCGGNAIENVIPKPFGSKYRYLRKALQQLPTLEPFREELTPILDRVNGLSEVRHTLTHATLESLVPKDGVFTFRHLRHGKLAHTVETKTFDLRDWPPIQDELMALHHTTGLLSKRLLEAFPKTTPGAVKSARPD